MTTFTDRVAALAIECATCFAEPGDPCCSEDGMQTVPIHAGRVTDLHETIHRGARAYADEEMRA